MDNKQGEMCLAQGHNTVTPLRLEPAVPRFGAFGSKNKNHKNLRLPSIVLNSVTQQAKNGHTS